MDIENKYETELIFQVESENKKDNKVFKTKKILKTAKESLKVLVLDRLNGRTGEC